MSVQLPRDRDGYLDVDTLPDIDAGFRLSDLAPTPPIGGDFWAGLVTSAVHISPDSVGIDVDALVGGGEGTALPPLPTSSVAGHLDGASSTDPTPGSAEADEHLDWPDPSSHPAPADPDDGEL